MGQKASGFVRPERLKWHGRLAAWFIHRVISLLSLTIRYSMDEDSHKNWAATPGPDRSADMGSRGPLPPTLTHA